MKKWNPVCRWLLLIGINALPFAVSWMIPTEWIFYEVLLLLPVLAVLISLNYRSSTNTWRYLLLQLYLLFWQFGSGVGMIKRYSDMSLEFGEALTLLAVRWYATLIGSGIILAVTLVTAIVKALRQRRKQTPIS